MTSTLISTQFFKENGYTTIGAGKVFHGGPSSNKHDCEYSWTGGCPYHNDADHYDPSPTSWQAVTPQQQASLLSSIVTVVEFHNESNGIIVSCIPVNTLIRFFEIFQDNLDQNSQKQGIFGFQSQFLRLKSP